jgi:hypothetical protein
MSAREIRVATCSQTDDLREKERRKKEKSFWLKPDFIFIFRIPIGVVQQQACQVAQTHGDVATSSTSQLGGRRKLVIGAEHRLHRSALSEPTGRRLPYWPIQRIGIDWNHVRYLFKIKVFILKYTS